MVQNSQNITQFEDLNANDLYSMWTDNEKRLENMNWRLWDYESNLTKSQGTITVTPRRTSKFYIPDEEENSDDDTSDDDYYVEEHNTDCSGVKTCIIKSIHQYKEDDDEVDEIAFMREFQKISPPPIKTSHQCQSLLTTLLKSQANNNM